MEGENEIGPASDPTHFDYDVAFSFAGEDRAYVQSVAKVLDALAIKVFYDAYEQNSLWGKDLYTHLDEVYRLKSQYCVMFLSRSYRDKLWTNHERKSAQASAFEERDEYILPVRLDDTEILGIRKTIGYLDGAKIEPQDLALRIAAKLGRDNEFNELMDILTNSFQMQGYEITQIENYLRFYNATEDYERTLSIRMLIEAVKSGDFEDVFLMSSLFVW